MVLVKINSCKGFIVSLKDKKLSYDGPLKRKLMINFGNLESSSWHFLKTKNKFRFSEDF